MKIWFISLIFSIFLFFFTYSAEAKSKIFSGSSGVIVTAGGDIWTEPEQPPNVRISGLPFNDLSGGYGVGGGMFFEGRFIKYVAIETDFLIEYNSQWYNMEYGGGVVELKYLINYVNYRIPFYIKAVIPAGIVRFSIGLGPEVVLSRHNKTDVKQNSGPDVSKSQIDEIKSSFRSRSQNDIYFSAGIGFAFKVWKFSIPLNLRYAYNLTQPKKLDDRIQTNCSWDQSCTIAYASFTASETMDLRLMLGLSYNF